MGTGSESSRCLSPFSKTLMKDFKDKVAVITGAASGIGRALADHCAREGMKVVLADVEPGALAEAAANIEREFNATCNITVGDDLLRDNFPTIHAVGRASTHAPRLIDLQWGRPNDPGLTLIGKGVCFDSGGLDIKAANNMRLMKKDMGGAAHVLGIARLVMAQQLRVRLRVLIPAVENAIAGNAFRTGDIIRTRKGLTVEIDNADAEGRLVLCDALALACEGDPGVIVDFATLTGAARTALGTELPAMFCNDDTFANALLAAGRDVARVPHEVAVAIRECDRIVERDLCSRSRAPCRAHRARGFDSDLERAVGQGLIEESLFGWVQGWVVAARGRGTGPGTGVVLRLKFKASKSNQRKAENDGGELQTPH